MTKFTPEDKNQWHGVIARKTTGGVWCYLLQTEPIPGMPEFRTEQIRSSARRYPLAFLYSEPVTGGNKTSMSRFFTFGLRPSPWYKHLLTETYTVAFLEEG